MPSSIMFTDDASPFQAHLPGVNVIKLFCPLFMDFRNKLVFVPGKLFQHSLMFVGKAGAYVSGPLFRC